MALGISALAEQLVNGLTLGIVYVLLAAGLSIIFGVMDVINFSHGELFALGAYFALSVIEPLGAGTGFVVALVVAPVLVGVVGAVIERTTLRPLYGRNPLYHILLTFGLVLVLNDLIVLIWGSQQRQLPVPELLNQPLAVGGVSASVYSAFMIVAGTALAVGTWLLLNRTRYGMIVRAGSMDRGMVRNLGIDIDRYYTLVFGFGAALAAVAGIILGGYQSVSPGMGNSVLVSAFVIVVLGGLGSFRGAIYGGLLVGVVQTFTRTYVPVLEGLTVFLLMIAVLLVRPQGLFGESGHGGGESDGDLLVGGNGGVLTAATRTRIGRAAVAGLAAAPVVLLAVGQPYYVTLLNTVLIWALFALSLDIVMGYTGLVPLGHTMFYGAGAYAAGLAMLHLSSSFVVALLVAALVGAVIAWVVGSVSIRVSGVYFAMITLAFAELLYQAVFKLDFTGGSDGLLGFEPTLGVAGFGPEFGDIELFVAGVEITGAVVFYYLAFLVVVGALVGSRRLMSAPFGSVLLSIRESEERSEFIGYDTTAYKRRAFVLAGSLGGLAGGLLAVNPSTFVISPDQTLAWIHSGEVIVMTLVGGMGTLYGPMVGAGLIIAVEDVLASVTDQWRLVVGTVFILFVIFVPRGLVSLPSLVADRRRAGGGPPGPESGREEVATDD
ncbi:ABC transporter permease [Halosegnis marinus]|uniref:ABC transporter permease n=1 Tax=Halosegnis marinus TaxID=3034023 RepID=A0ABD5ZR91_9EURY|nr:ABC transporter permease [Halosegnis sp. DT85]